MDPEEKGQGKAEQIKGKIKETTGKVTGNEELRHEGKFEQGKGKLRETKEDVKDSVEGTIKGLRGDDDEREEGSSGEGRT